MLNIRNLSTLWFQIALIILIWLIAGLIHQYILSFIPQGLIGMFSLFLLLVTKIIPYQWVQKGSAFLIGTMLLFFIPAVMTIIDYKELILDSGIILFSSVIISTFLVITSVAWVVEKTYKFELKIQKKEKK